MDAFLKILQTLPEASELIARVENGGCPAVLTGTAPVQRACIGAAVAAGTGRPAVFLCADEREARQLAGDLQSLTGQEPVTLLAREWQFRPNAVASREWERSRLAALYRMASGAVPAVVATIDALMTRTLPPQRLHAAPRRPGGTRCADGAAGAGGLQPVRTGGGCGPIRHPGRHSGRFLPTDGAAGALRIFR